MKVISELKYNVTPEDNSQRAHTRAVRMPRSLTYPSNMKASKGDATVPSVMEVVMVMVLHRDLKIDRIGGVMVLTQRASADRIYS